MTTYDNLTISRIKNGWLLELEGKTEDKDDEGYFYEKYFKEDGEGVVDFVKKWLPRLARSK